MNGGQKAAAPITKDSLTNWTTAIAICGTMVMATYYFTANNAELRHNIDTNAEDISDLQARVDKHESRGHD